MKCGGLAIVLVHKKLKDIHVQCSICAVLAIVCCDS